MKKRFVIGDIHGANKALLQCLDKAQFDQENDLLISLGDVCDGWPETNEAIETLLSIKHLIFVQGNHDFWTLNWALSNRVDDVWYSQGGKQTMDSYPDGMPQAHIDLLYNAPIYYELENKLFVHAGITPGQPVADQGADTLLWDRALFRTAMAKPEDCEENITGYDEVYLGHTPTHRYGFFAPVKRCEIWLMDTGAAWEGPLSMMDIDSKALYISDKVQTLYPSGSGRI